MSNACVCVYIYIYIYIPAFSCTAELRTSPATWPRNIM